MTVRKFLLFGILSFLIIRNSELISKFFLNLGYLNLNNSGLSDYYSQSLNHSQAPLAASFFNSSLKRNANEYSSLRGLGFSLLELGQSESALEVWSEIPFPMAEEMIVWGDLALESEQYSSAVDWYQLALFLNDNNDLCPIYYRLSTAYELKDDLVQTRQFLSKCVQSGEFFPEAYIRLCMSYVHSDEVDDAIVLFASSIIAIQKDPSMLACVGTGYMRVGRPEKALEYFEEAISADPNRASFYQWASLAYTRLGKFDEAIMSSERATSLDGSKIDYWQHLGNLYEETGRLKEAQLVREKIFTLETRD